ncbi:hypothetical protein P9A14_04980 [Gordonia hongkongensis]|uniref:Transcriptional regulator, AbiEi antitoxin, Type IV TA system n=1 Tax=Gordonia hongkongensis TaxID=1701090 RepID=A0AAX3TA46_9ACTN|nr:hypothetical protein [Gordonia hongkongensis]MDF6099729.1 hypothetical protein [Gordonia hongkongensis]OCW86608.1 hypothetical protein A8M60_20490 [Nocardia farcinica]QIK49220.1 hypothetical protein G8C36_19780 [Gordonia terrae]WFP25870.1 hypothetical protein P9A14_04980 [Gordonia hongkongensis]
MAWFPADSFPTDRHGLIRREATLRAGIGDGVVTAAVARGALVRLAPGVWIAASAEFDGPDGADRLYRKRSIAVATSARDRGVATLSHQSAAALLGLATLHPQRETVHLTKPSSSSGGFVRGHRHVHNGPLGRDETVVVEGVLVTRAERTAVDIAMSGDFAQALVVFDQALRMGADPGLMSAMVDSRAGWRNVGVARQALDVADARAESVGESWSRAQMVLAGLPTPRLQHTFQTPHGEARADFDWDGRIIGEFDGLQKYGLVVPGESPRDVLIREKQREDALRAQGIVVIRWTWATLESGELVGLLRPWLAKFGHTAA